MNRKFISSCVTKPIFFSFWRRKPKPESLLHMSLCPNNTGIAVDRDPISGRLLGYQEVCSIIIYI